jgi:hypothetical protein
MQFDIEILAAITQAYRALTLVVGALVLIDCAKTFAGLKENPPHNPHKNAMAWGFVAAGTFIGATSLMLYGRPISSAAPDLIYSLTICFLWAFVSTGLVIRSASRVHRPLFIHASSVLFLIAGTLLSYWS